MGYYTAYYNTLKPFASDAQLGDGKNKKVINYGLLWLFQT